jgi:hypothetical protein
MFVEKEFMRGVATSEIIATNNAVFPRGLFSSIPHIFKRWLKLMEAVEFSIT